MKKFIEKIICVIILMVLLINSNVLLIISNAIEENAEDAQEMQETFGNIELEKYINYNIDDKKGMLIQVDLKLGLKTPENQEYKPLENTEVVLTSPKIEENYPENVEVIGNKTLMTNGKEDNIEVDYQYNKENGEITIKANNDADENGNIYNEKKENAIDEYKVIYYYGESSYSSENIKRDIEINANIKEKLYSQEEQVLEATCNMSKEVTENIGEIISTNTKTSDIYNGYIYANAVNGTNNRTQYTENTQIEVSYKEIADKLNISIENKFENNDSDIETEDIVYKSTILDKQNILDVLGENGSIIILDKDNKELAKIDKDTQETEGGIVEINYENEETQIKLQTTKPIKVGTLNIRT